MDSSKLIIRNPCGLTSMYTAARKFWGRHLCHLCHLASWSTRKILGWFPNVHFLHYPLANVYMGKINMFINGSINYFYGHGFNSYVWLPEGRWCPHEIVDATIYTWFCWLSTVKKHKWQYVLQGERAKPEHDLVNVRVGDVNYCCVR